jgi:DNA-binding PadR family transcriptional regulator
VSSIRLYILSALADEGDMHGHQLRQLAEKEHVDEWTDVTVGALYGALKRLHAEGLIEEMRVEREGAYPERQVWGITREGRVALGGLRHEGLREIVMKPDPFDLAVSRLDRTRIDELPVMLSVRVLKLKAMLAENETHTDYIAQYLTPLEKFVMKHKADRLRGEILWHEQLANELPDIITAEKLSAATSTAASLTAATLTAATSREDTA